MKALITHRPISVRTRSRAARLICLLFCWGALGWAVGGCEQNPDEPPTTDVTGAWRTTTWISAYVPGDNVNVTWSLTQTGSSIYGNFVDNLNRSGTIGGSISGTKVFLTFSYWTNTSWTVEYESTAVSNSMSGCFRGEGEVKLGDAQRVLFTQ